MKVVVAGSSGLIGSALVTAFRADGSLDLDPVDAHAELLTRNAVRGRRARGRRRHAKYDGRWEGLLRK